MAMAPSEPTFQRLPNELLAQILGYALEHGRSSINSTKRHSYDTFLSNNGMLMQYSLVSPLWHRFVLENFLSSSSFTFKLSTKLRRDRPLERPTLNKAHLPPRHIRRYFRRVKIYFNFANWHRNVPSDLGHDPGKRREFFQNHPLLQAMVGLTSPDVGFDNLKKLTVYIQTGDGLPEECWKVLEEQEIVFKARKVDLVVNYGQREFFLGLIKIEHARQQAEPE